MRKSLTGRLLLSMHISPAALPGVVQARAMRPGQKPCSRPTRGMWKALSTSSSLLVPQARFLSRAHAHVCARAHTVPAKQVSVSISMHVYIYIDIYVYLYLCIFMAGGGNVSTSETQETRGDGVRIGQGSTSTSIQTDARDEGVCIGHGSTSTSTQGETRGDGVRTVRGQGAHPSDHGSGDVICDRRRRHTCIDTRTRTHTHTPSL